MFSHVCCFSPTFVSINVKLSDKSMNLCTSLVVYIWDDVLKKLVIELSFGCPVMGVRVRRDK